MTYPYDEEKHYVRNFGLLIFTGCFMITSWLIAWSADVGASNYTSELTLADDASTPEKKAEYLGQFIAKAKSEPVAEYGAIVYKNPRTKIDQQIVVLESLKKRCEDLRGLNKESMGYSQGMTQITGQEFIHAIDNIRGIFKTAWALHYYGVFFVTLWWWSWLPFLAWVITIITLYFP